MDYGRGLRGRLRVADALEGLPTMEAALDAGELTYSAVRELTRIATRKTEEAWLDTCRGKVLRQIEELVAEREPGDGPDAAPKPDLRPKRVSMDLRPAVVARMRQAQAALDSVRGERNDCNDLLDEAFRCLLMMHGTQRTRPSTLARANGVGPDRDDHQVRELRPGLADRGRSEDRAHTRGARDRGMRRREHRIARWSAEACELDDPAENQEAREAAR